MASKPPKIVVPGLSRGKGIPKGYLLGRVDSGRGPVQLVRGQQLMRLGIASASATNSKLAQCGFTFYAGGLMLSNEDLGSGSWAHDVTFQNGVDGSSIISQTPATSTAVFNIYALQISGPTLIGTITFSAGGSVGLLNFPASFTIPAGTAVRLNAPSPADATLASVTGTVVGINP